MPTGSGPKAHYNKDMKRRTFISSALALPLLGTPMLGHAQDQRTLGEVSKYLNQLRSVQGRFRQISPNGARTGGKFFMVRPGLIRFEYDRESALVIADGINIGIFDSKSNARANKYLLSQTPLRLLLQKDIDLTEPGISRSTSNDGANTSVVLVDPKRPNDGTMTLVFSNSPPALTQWIVREKTGEQTTVILEDLQKVSGLNRRLFNIEWEQLQRQ